MQHARIVVYIAAAPDAETRRLQSDARRLEKAGKRVEIGTLDSFYLSKTLEAKPDVVILDSLERNERWRAAQQLREANISVVGAFNIAHLEKVVPLSFLKGADEVIALDAPHEGTSPALRELMLRTIDDLTIPVVSAATASTAVAVLPANVDAHRFLARCAPIASALDLALEVVPSIGSDHAHLLLEAHEHSADVLPPQDLSRIDVASLKASLLVLTNGKLAAKITNTPVDRDVFIADATQSFIEQTAHTTPLSGTLGDRMRVGYGKLTVFLGAAAGAGTTYAMLDRASQLKAEGEDVVIGFVDPQGHEETQALANDFPVIPLKTRYLNGITYHELDREAILARKPGIVLIDDLAHTNAPLSLAPKRYLDVLALLRAGISVLTTLNVKHLEALSDAIYRLTGKVVRDTLPDGILPLADDVILIDVSPETLQERQRGEKTSLETLAALRELAIRETLRAKTRERIAAPFKRLLVSVVARPDDLLLVRKAGRLAARLEVDFSIAHIAEPKDVVDAEQIAEFERFARVGNAEWINERAPDAAVRLLEVARSAPETVVAVGGTHRQPRWPARNSFARRMLDAGARELIVLARPTPSFE